MPRKPGITIRVRVPADYDPTAPITFDVPAWMDEAALSTIANTVAHAWQEHHLPGTFPMTFALAVEDAP
jgi:hypothetical protein